MIQLNGNRLYQWETGRTVSVGNVSKVQFANQGDSVAVAVTPSEGTAKIPDKLLRTGRPIFVYTVNVDGDNNEVVQEARTFPVQYRARPKDYLPTEAEEAIGELKKITQAALEAAAKAEAAANVLVVTADTVEETVNVTAEEIYAHVQKDGDVYLNEDGEYYTLLSALPTRATFMCYSDRGNTGWGDTIDFVFVQSGFYWKEMIRYKKFAVIDDTSTTDAAWSAAKIIQEIRDNRVLIVQTSVDRFGAEAYATMSAAQINAFIDNGGTALLVNHTGKKFSVLSERASGAVSFVREDVVNGVRTTLEYVVDDNKQVVTNQYPLGGGGYIDENGKAKGLLDMDGHAITNAWSVNINQKGEEGVAIYAGAYEAIDGETEAAVMEFYGTHGDEKVRLRNLAPGVNADDAATVGQMKSSVGDIETALDSIIAIQKELIGVITFTISDAGYQALNGMTWGRWVESEYNTDGFVIDDEGILNDVDMLPVYDEVHGDTQYENMSPVDGAVYTV